MEKNEKVIVEKETTRNEPNYRGIKAMPFIVGNGTVSFKTHACKNIHYSSFFLSFPGIDFHSILTL